VVSNWTSLAQNSPSRYRLKPGHGYSELHKRNCWHARDPKSKSGGRSRRKAGADTEP